MLSMLTYAPPSLNGHLGKGCFADDQGHIGPGHRHHCSDLLWASPLYPHLPKTPRAGGNT